MRDDTKSHLLKLLPQGSLYDFIPGLIPLTLDYGEFYIAKKGERLAQEGEDIKYFMLPIDENIKLVKTKDDKEVSIGYLQRKRSLALGEILFDSQYQYSAVCETATRIIRLDKKRFLDLLKKNKPIEYYLRLIVQSSGLRSFKVFLEEKGLKKSQIVEIFNKIILNEHKLPSGEIIPSTSGKLYFLKKGELEINFIKTDTKYRKLKIFEGSFFGGEALLPPYQTSYQAKAITDIEYHYAAIMDIIPELEKFNLIDDFYREPWVTKRAKMKRVNAWKGTLSPSIGEVISPKELNKLNLSNMDNIAELAKSDKHSFYLSTLFICNMLDIHVNQTAILNQVSRIEFLSPTKLSSLFENYPIVSNNTKLVFEDLDDINKPFLFIYTNRLFVFLKSVDNFAYVYDSAIGIVKINSKEIFDAPIDCIILEKTVISEPGASVAKTFINPLLNTKNIFLFIISLMGLTFIFNLLQPYLLQLMMDEALLLKDTSTLLSVGVGLILLLVFSTSCNFLLQYFFREVTINYDRKLSGLFYKSALNKPLSFFRVNNTGEILSRFFELENIRNMISIDSLQAIVDISSVIIYSLILFAYDTTLAAMPFLFLIACFIIQYFYLKRLKKNNIKAFKLVSFRNSLVSEILKYISALKFANAQTNLKHRWETSLIEFLKLKRIIQNENAFVNLLLDLGTIAIRIGTIWLAVILSIKGELSTGAILAISIYVNKATDPIWSLNLFFLKSQRSMLAFEKVGDIIQPEKDLYTNTTNHYLNLKGKIKLERIFFRYKNDGPWNLTNINLTIHAGQCLAIVGPSGCGKTTLAKVLSGLIEPDSGRIFYDDYDSDFLVKTCIHDQITFTGQDTNLYSGTIEENIVVDDDYIDNDRLSNALTFSNSHDIYESIHKDFGNALSTGGKTLSMGQRQKISIARAIYKRPSCLVMDEMTSALDPFTEKKIFQNIRENLLDTTQIIISHKRSAIKHADQIIVMDRGNIVEVGTHKDLLEKEGLYSRLFY